MVHAVIDPADAGHKPTETESHPPKHGMRDFFRNAHDVENQNEGG